MKKNRLKLFGESVAQKDDFKNASHEKIANTLLEIIESQNDAITIGLEGKWGSGKSTIINILCNKLKAKPRTIIYKFDAWSHEDDSLRIAFLANLISHINYELEKKESLSECQPKEKSEYKKYLTKYLSDKMDEVKGKVKKVINKSVKTSTRFGKFLATSIIFVPIGSALFSKSVQNTTTFTPEIIYHNIINYRIEKIIPDIISMPIIPLFSILLLFSPALLVIIWAFIGKRIDPEHNKWEFISTDANDKVVQNIIEMGDKTSCEYEKIFIDIIDVIVGEEKPFDKMVIIIDNIDRVSNDIAKSIWSSLQVFINSQHNKSSAVWFIVPFDEMAFRKIWDGEKTETSNHTEISTSYIEKTFQIIIDVPTPIISGWIQYLTLMAQTAFEKWGDKNLADELIKQYCSIYNESYASPTPRSIKNLINQVQSLYVRFETEEGITISAITIYAILRKTMTKSAIKSLLLYPQDSSLNETIMDTVIEHKKEISAILYHESYINGYELLLSEELSNLINSGTNEQLKELNELQLRHTEAFWQAWKKHFKTILLYRPEINIHESKLLIHLSANYLKSNKDTPPLSEYIDKSLNFLSENAIVFFDKSEFNDGLELIKNMKSLRTIGEEQTTKICAYICSIINSHRIPLSNEISSSSISNSAIKYIETIREVVSLLSITVIQCDQIASWEHYSKWHEFLNKAHVELPQVFPSESASDEIVKHIFAEPYVDGNHIKRLCAMAILNPTWSGWAKVITRICDWLKRPAREDIYSQSARNSRHRKADDNSMIFLLIYVLMERSGNETITNEISALIRGDSLHSSLYYEFNANKNNTWLALLMEFSTDKVSLSQDTFANIKRLSEPYIKDTNKVDEMLSKFMIDNNFI